MVRRDQINDRLKFAAENSRKNVFAALSTSQEGLADEPGRTAAGTPW